MFSPEPVELLLMIAAAFIMGVVSVPILVICLVWQAKIK